MGDSNRLLALRLVGALWPRASSQFRSGWLVPSGGRRTSSTTAASCQDDPERDHLGVRADARATCRNSSHDSQLRRRVCRPIRCARASLHPTDLSHAAVAVDQSKPRRPACDDAGALSLKANGNCGLLQGTSEAEQGRGLVDGRLVPRRPVAPRNSGTAFRPELSAGRHSSVFHRAQRSSKRGSSADGRSLKH